MHDDHNGYNWLISYNKCSLKMWFGLEEHSQDNFNFLMSMTQDDGLGNSRVDLLRSQMEDDCGGGDDDLRRSQSLGDKPTQNMLTVIQQSIDNENLKKGLRFEDLLKTCLTQYLQNADQTQKGEDDSFEFAEMDLINPFLEEFKI